MSGRSVQDFFFFSLPFLFLFWFILCEGFMELHVVSNSLTTDFPDLSFFAVQVIGLQTQPFLAYAVLGLESIALCVLGKHSPT